MKIQRQSLFNLNASFLIAAAGRVMLINLMIRR